MNLFSETIQRVDKAFQKNEFDRSKVWKSFYIGPEGTKDEKGQPIDVPDEYAQQLVNTYPDKYFTEEGWAKFQEIVKRNKVETPVEEPAPVITPEPEENLDEETDKPTEEELSAMTVQQLKGIATEMGLQYANNIIKMDLVNLILQNA